MGNILTKRNAIIIGLGLIAVGYVMKSGRDAVKSGKKVEETIAGKLGLIA